MADDVLTLPIVKLEIPKPRLWDFIALAVLGTGAVATAANVAASGLVGASGSISASMTMAFATVALIVCIVSLLVLGKTAKEGTIWGNLFAVGGMMVGLTGMMLAAALWALA